MNNDRTKMNETELPEISAEAMDNLLADLDIEDDGDIHEIEEPSEQMTADEEAALSTKLTIAEAHEEQGAEAAASTVTLEAPAVATSTKRAKSLKTAGTPKAAKAPRDLSSLPASVFVLSKSAPVDLDANKTVVMALLPTQKKIAEKFNNFFVAVNAGKAPSKYVMDCFGILDTKGTVTSVELIAGLRAINSNKGTGYTQGTASSQVGQFMTLAPLLEIANRSKNTLTINPDSALVDILKSLSV